ncbi:hypothetical protein H072_7762 [Dactylellina haptotyla CBS 200.50]|uniref:Uncharacterized protein n=1 Tax=Dactylellina haptotyla (strain CBS 200.50) TaxID=1284197 RepID=S8BTD2_DACHA|nr:hypothetical protein H072_7762 [Dactylellina haptotyla CBS 200.50]
MLVKALNCLGRNLRPTYSAQGKLDFALQSNADDLSRFIDQSNIPRFLGGDEDWRYVYHEPVSSENAVIREPSRHELHHKRRLDATRWEIVQEYEENTLQWVKRESDCKYEVMDLKDGRRLLREDLRANYWALDRFIRARTYYDRIGMLNRDGGLSFHPWRRGSDRNKPVDTVTWVSFTDTPSDASSTFAIISSSSAVTKAFASSKIDKNIHVSTSLPKFKNTYGVIIPESPSSFVTTVVTTKIPVHPTTGGVNGNNSDPSSDESKPLLSYSHPSNDDKNIKTAIQDADVARKGDLAPKLALTLENHEVKKWVDTKIFHTDFTAWCPPIQWIHDNMSRDPGAYDKLPSASTKGKNVKDRPDFRRFSFKQDGTLDEATLVRYRYYTARCRRCFCDPDLAVLQVNPNANGDPKHCGSPTLPAQCVFWFGCQCRAKMQLPIYNPTIPLQDYQTALSLVPQILRVAYPEYRWYYDYVNGFYISWNGFGQEIRNIEQPAPYEPNWEDHHGELVPGMAEPYYLEGPDPGPANVQGPFQLMDAAEQAIRGLDYIGRIMPFAAAARGRLPGGRGGGGGGAIGPPPGPNKRIAPPDNRLGKRDSSSGGEVSSVPTAPLKENKSFEKKISQVWCPSLALIKDDLKFRHLFEEHRANRRSTEGEKDPISGTKDGAVLKEYESQLRRCRACHCAYNGDLVTNNDDSKIPRTDRCDDPLLVSVCTELYGCICSTTFTMQNGNSMNSDIVYRRQSSRSSNTPSTDEKEEMHNKRIDGKLSTGEYLNKYNPKYLGDIIRKHVGKASIPPRFPKGTGDEELSPPGVAQGQLGRMIHEYLLLQDIWITLRPRAHKFRLQNQLKGRKEKLSRAKMPLAGLPWDIFPVAKKPRYILNGGIGEETDTASLLGNDHDHEKRMDSSSSNSLISSANTEAWCPPARWIHENFPTDPSPYPRFDEHPRIRTNYTEDGTLPVQEIYKRYRYHLARCKNCICDANGFLAPQPVGSHTGNRHYACTRQTWPERCALWYGCNCVVAGTGKNLKFETKINWGPNIKGGLDSTNKYGSIGFASGESSAGGPGIDSQASGSSYNLDNLLESLSMEIGAIPLSNNRRLAPNTAEPYWLEGPDLIPGKPTWDYLFEQALNIAAGTLGGYLKQNPGLLGDGDDGGLRLVVADAKVKREKGDTDGYDDSFCRKDDIPQPKSP